MADLYTDMEKSLCEALCAEVRIVARPNNVFAVSTPLTFPDGDSLPIFLRRLPEGGVEFTDMGNSLMRLSYETDAPALREGTRGRILSQLLAEFGLEDRRGELVLAVPGHQTGLGVFKFSQALTRVHDLSFLNRVNVESTFYEDLRKDLEEIVGDRRMILNYTVPAIGPDYPIDYFIPGSRLPLYVFGVPNQDKARLATIVLQHLLSNGQIFDSAVVFRDADLLPRRDFNRLANVANDIVTSADATEDLTRKIKHRLAA
ncbi:MAG: DUF1828 domain-containing protein [Proteobacteria bacterium]|nr:DUF1828 domain-containing protein [Pseudomonadota bacterium]